MMKNVFHTKRDANRRQGRTPRRRIWNDKKKIYWEIKVFGNITYMKKYIRGCKIIDF